MGLEKIEEAVEQGNARAVLEAARMIEDSQYGSGPVEGPEPTAVEPTAPAPAPAPPDLQADLNQSRRDTQVKDLIIKGMLRAKRNLTAREAKDSKLEDLMKLISEYGKKPDEEIAQGLDLWNAPGPY